MPIRHLIDSGFTIGPRETQNWTWNWFGMGPNKGPVIFFADPKNGPNPTFRKALRVVDVAKCRGGPGDPNAPEVFYSFKIINDSDNTVAFRLEIVRFDDVPIS